MEKTTQTEKVIKRAYIKKNLKQLSPLFYCVTNSWPITEQFNGYIDITVSL